MAKEGVRALIPLSATMTADVFPPYSLVELRPHAYPKGFLSVDDESNVCAKCEFKPGYSDDVMAQHDTWDVYFNNGVEIQLMNYSPSTQQRPYHLKRLVLRVNDKEGKLETAPYLSTSYDDREASLFRTEHVRTKAGDRGTVRLFLEYPRGLDPTTRYYVTINEKGLPGCANSANEAFKLEHSCFDWKLKGGNDTSWETGKITVQSRSEHCDLAILEYTVELIETLKGVEINIHKEDGGLYTFESTAKNYEGSFLNVSIDDDNKKIFSAGPKTQYSYFRLLRVSDKYIAVMSNKYEFNFLRVKYEGQSKVLDLTYNPLDFDGQWLFEKVKVTE